MSEFLEKLVCVCCGRRIGRLLETCDALISFSEKLHFAVHHSCMKKR